MKYSNQLKNIFLNDCQIIGKERFLNSAVLIPIVNLGDEEFILFEKRSALVRQPGEISFPGGHFDFKNDKDFLSTALRETTEELGITKEKINVLGKLGTLVTPMGIIVETFVGYLNIKTLAELNLDIKEVDRIFVIPLEYFVKTNPQEYHNRLELHPFYVDEQGVQQELLPIKDLGLPEKYSLPWTKGKHRVLVYQTGEEVIWGITAELIFELSKKLRD